jgi:xanthine dehydrogenase accessory factor
VSDHFSRLAALERERRSFALATVVARRAPVSSHLGDRALVFADGTMEGFVGGSCSREIIRREALRTLRTGLPRLVQIRPRPGEEPDAVLRQAQHECVVVAMGCASEGAVDVYVEPHLPLPRLIVAGDTPVAGALARVAAQIGYEVVRVVLATEIEGLAPIAGVRVVALDAIGELMLRQAPHDMGETGEAGGGFDVAIVASQGNYDEAALAPLLASDLAFVGLLASRRRARAVLDALAAEGVAAEQLARVRAPVGLDIGARSPGDVAISILADIIATLPRPDVAAPPDVMVSLANHEREIPSPAATALDPVCGMEVAIAGARYTLDHDGVRSYFCCAGCRTAYATEREHALTPGGTA